MQENTNGRKVFNLQNALLIFKFFSCLEIVLGFFRHDAADGLNIFVHLLDTCAESRHAQTV